MSETVKAIVSALAVVVVNVAALLGYNVSEDATLQVLSAIALLASTAWGIWHNYNFTKAAQDAQKVLDAEKGK